MVTICTFNDQTLASEASIEDPLMRARKIRIGDCGVGVLINTNLAMNIDSFKQLTTRIERLRLRSALMPAFDGLRRLRSYDGDEIEAFYMGLEKFYREKHTFYKVVGDFNAKVDPRRTPEKPNIGTHGIEWNEQEERLPSLS
ncbi:hypothetical protein Y032_0653g1171 [Ancylostoma ceylanicum]|nr:hypothetical protein Y032_0653g1171 [Ancylostoma ceylanicum]